MKCLLVAVNAKYIHSNPAIMSLKAYYDKYSSAQAEVITCEYTINQQMDFIVSDIYEKQPNVVCFSCYIWNVEEIKYIADTLKKVMPKLKIWAGGPEVSYRAEEFLKCNSAFDGIMCGEGEKTFTNLMSALEGKCGLKDIAGICYRAEEIKHNPMSEPMDMNEIPFIYEDLSDFENRIIYYESSRGCPFSCSYCLSSIDKKLRFKDIQNVKKELSFFIDNKVKQIKFIDRTFNAKKNHAMEIWSFIHENDNGITNFHFEVAADLIDDEQLELFKKMRPGLIQLEIGIQSTNAETITEINRTMNLDKVYRVIRVINSYGNIHQHVDLIAGLPYETLEIFKKSFNDVYALKCDQLQLGFLKVLSGSKMYDESNNYEIKYTSTAPYEVLSTKWITYYDVIKLKQIEEMVEIYYNSGQFKKTVELLEIYYDNPFELYEKLGEFYHNKFKQNEKHSRIARYELLLEFAKEEKIPVINSLCECMTYDIYIRENCKKRPEFAIDLNDYKDKLKELYKKYSQSGKNIHIDIFDGKYVLFDYDERGVDGNAKAKICE
ncbi:MAG: DUF4080 domain-containing protein [Lachnospira sp.]|nr:DUF4080 domain-containing protein [Lachnospira sp.]